MTTDREAAKYVCELCGLEADQRLFDGVNNHWRKGYVWPLRPTTNDAICYGSLVERQSTPPASSPPGETP